MSPSGDIAVVDTYSNEFDAEIARSVLESAGVEAHLLSDDAGGVYPQMHMVRGIRLIVAATELERARELLRDDRTQDDPGSS